MQSKKAKNILVLKGIASNIIEEATVVLKPNVKIKQKEFIDKNSKLEKVNVQKDYIVGEAESVILTYIKKIENEKRLNKKINSLKKYRFLQISNIILIIILIYTVVF